jgi:hypothetical protein
MSRKHVAVAILPLLLGGWTASDDPRGVTTLYSQSFQFDGDCNNWGDMVHSWSIAGWAGPGPVVRPFTPGSISIRGVELVLLIAPSAYNMWMVGNNADGDAMAFLAPGQAHVMNWFPAGLAFQFPGTNDARNSDYIDLHGGCESGHVSIMETLYYTPN